MKTTIEQETRKIDNNDIEFLNEYYLTRLNVEVLAKTQRFANRQLSVEDIFAVVYGTSELNGENETVETGILLERVRIFEGLSKLFHRQEVLEQIERAEYK